MPRKLTQQVLAGIFVSALLLAGLAFADTVNIGGSTAGTGSSVTGVGAMFISGAVGPSAALFNSHYYSCTTNRYVSTTGNDANDGTASDNGHAWLTLNRANAAVPSAGWCINVLPGNYATGVYATNGGSTASSTGYVVYRCTVMDACVITDPGSQGAGALHAAIALGANYLMVDGFNVTASSSVNFRSGISSTNATGAYVFANHHLWVLNNVVRGYPQSGIQMNDDDYVYVIHNTLYSDATGLNCDNGAQGSGIALVEEIPAPAYTPIADDANNPITGNTGTLFRIFVMWNITYNNHVNCNPGAATDGNGIILDSWGWGCNAGNTTCIAGSSPYLMGGLVAFNVSFNNGGGGVHGFASPYVTIANNSCFNNVIDPNNTASTRACIDDNTSQGDTIINNVASALCAAAGVTNVNTAVGPFGPGDGVHTTTLNMAGGLTAGATSITVTANTTFPGGATGWAFNGSFALPGGNQIVIDSEVMLVTAGWGSNTWTVQRGYYGTTAAAHLNGATVQWIPNYWANNVSYAPPPCANGDGSAFTFNGSLYSTTQNKANTLPGWVNVGLSSPGTEDTLPVYANFALAPGSPAIGYGQTQTWLPAQSVDAGACPHNLLSCP